MDSKSDWWALECADCSFRTEYCAPAAELADLYRASMEDHASHMLRMRSESGGVVELSRGDNAENERLWRAVYFAAGMIDEYQKAIGQRPELVQEGFCQSGLFRNALAALRMIAQGLDGESAMTSEKDGPATGIQGQPQARNLP